MIILLTLIFLAIDFFSKLIVSSLLSVGQTVPIIKAFFYITYVRNTGAAWSMLSDKTYIVSIVSGLIILAIIWYIWKNEPENKLEKLGYSMVLGGALGNFIDRIAYGYVIDFLDIYIFEYDYPIFNLADSFIVIGIIILIIVTWRKDRNENRSGKQRSKNR